MNHPPALRLADIESARRLIADGIRRTPCDHSPALSNLAGRAIWLKREDLQRTGSFKERGARHALLRLGAEARDCGVIAASAGNHALGLAYHGAQLGIKVSVVMPLRAPEIKVSRCRSLGAQVILHGEGYDAAQAYARDLAQRTGAALIHPFDDLDVIAGQGTLGLEMLEQVAAFDTVVVPVGGGGLLAGVATAIKAARPRVRIVAVEPDEGACFAAALRQGGPVNTAVGSTLADGLAVGRAGANTFALAAALVDEAVAVTEDEIAMAISILARRAGIVAEGAAAVGLAAVLKGAVRGDCAVLPICGRNIDPRRHERVVAESELRCAGDGQPALAVPLSANPPERLWE